MWSVVLWSELKWFMCKWFCFEVKWSELRWSFGDKGTMYIRVTVYWGYLIVLWLFHVVCILCCGYFNWFVMCGCVYVWILLCVGVLVICVLVFTVFCIVCTVFCISSFMYIICFVCSSVRTTATEWKLNCSNNNNNNKKKKKKIMIIIRVVTRDR